MERKNGKASGIEKAVGLALAGACGGSAFILMVCEADSLSVLALTKLAGVALAVLAAWLFKRSPARRELERWIEED